MNHEKSEVFQLHNDLFKISQHGISEDVKLHAGVMDYSVISCTVSLPGLSVTFTVILLPASSGFGPVAV